MRSAKNVQQGSQLSPRCGPSGLSHNSASCTSTPRRLRQCCTNASPALRQLLTAHMPERQVDRLLLLHPELAAIPQQAAEEAVQQLLGMGLDGQDLARVCLRHAQALATRKEQVEEVLAFLKEDLHMGAAEQRSVVARFPQVLTYGVKAHLRPHVAYLESLGEEDVAGLVQQRPAVLGEGIEGVVKFLQLCRLPRKQIHRVLRSYPLADYGFRLNAGYEAPAEGEDEGEAKDGADGAV